MPIRKDGTRLCVPVQFMELLRAYASDEDDDGQEGEATKAVEPVAVLQLAIVGWKQKSNVIPDHEDERQRRAVVTEMQRICDLEWNTNTQQEPPKTLASSRKRDRDDGAAPKERRVVVRSFGSWHYGLHVTSSDVDLNLWAAAPIPDFFASLLRRLSSLTPPVPCQVTSNRARIASAKLELMGLSVDVVHECGEGSDFDHSMQVSAWVRKWLQRIPKIETVARIVKCWASHAAINRSYSHTLPSLALLVMLFAVAETLEAQHSHAQFEAILLTAFFERYSVWPHKGEVIRTRDCVASPPPEGYERYDTESTSGFGETLFIQDPFLSRINLGRFVTILSKNKILLAFQRAAEVCRRPNRKSIFTLTGEEG